MIEHPMIIVRGLTISAFLLGIVNQGGLAADEPVARKPLFRVADMNVGESQAVELSDGSTAKLMLLGVEETRDNVRDALRLARVKVKVNDVVTTIESGNYRLPVTV